MNLLFVISPFIIVLLLFSYFKDNFKENYKNNTNNKNNKNNDNSISSMKSNNSNKKEIPSAPPMKNKIYKENELKNFETDRCNNKNNINDKINKAFIEKSKEIRKYKLGAKSYEYDFIPNEQPLKGLKPDYEQNYPSTLKKFNKMFVDPDLTIKYGDILNTKNNSLKTYYDNYL